MCTKRRRFFFFPAAIVRGRNLSEIFSGLTAKVTKKPRRRRMVTFNIFGSRSTRGGKKWNKNYRKKYALQKWRKICSFPREIASFSPTTKYRQSRRPGKSARSNHAVISSPALSDAPIPRLHQKLGNLGRLSRTGLSLHDDRLAMLHLLDETRGLKDINNTIYTRRSAYSTGPLVRT